MRIFQVADLDVRTPGSFIAMVQAGARAARDRGWTLELLLPSRAGGREWVQDLRAGGVPVGLLPDAGRREVVGELRARLAAEAGPALLHTHFASYDIPSVVAATGRRDAIVVWHVHATLSAAPRTRIRNTLSFGVLGRRVGAFLCVADDVARDVRRRLAPRRRVQVFPNAIDVARFRLGLPADRTRTRRELGVSDHEIVLLHFGWDWRRKGGDVLVDVVGRLRRQGRNVVGLSVNGGQAATEAARAAGLEGSVRPLAPAADVTRLYWAADLFLAPSRAEGMPFALIEALSAGLPAVASSGPAGHRALGPGLPAYRVVELEASAMARGAGELLDRPPQVARQEARVTREALVGRFDLIPWSDRLMELYGRLSARQPDTATARPKGS